MSQSSYDFLNQIELFKGMTPEQFNELIRALRPQRYNTGELIFRQGEQGLAAYVVQSGTVEIFLSEGTRSTMLRHFKGGEVFGELALIDGAPRSAAARALTPCELLCLDKGVFDELRAQLRPAAFHVLRHLSNNLCVRIREANEQIEDLMTTGHIEKHHESSMISARVEPAKASSQGLLGRLGSMFKR